MATYMEHASSFLIRTVYHGIGTMVPDMELHLKKSNMRVRFTDSELLTGGTGNEIIVNSLSYIQQLLFIQNIFPFLVIG